MSLVESCQGLLIHCGARFKRAAAGFSRQSPGVSFCDEDGELKFAAAR